MNKNYVKILWLNMIINFMNSDHHWISLLSSSMSWCFRVTFSLIYFWSYSFISSSLMLIFLWNWPNNFYLVYSSSRMIASTPIYFSWYFFVKLVNYYLFRLFYCSSWDTSELKYFLSVYAASSLVSRSFNEFTISCLSFRAKIWLAFEFSISTFSRLHSAVRF